MRPQSAAVLARALFFVTVRKTRKNPPNFGNFSRKKNGIFYCKNGSFMVGTKIKKLSKILESLSLFGHNTKNIPNIEILVFFDPVGPQDAMFDKNRFFQTFTSFSKVRAKKRTTKLLMTGQ